MLVLDEPTFGQDATTWRELARLIVSLRDEVGVGVVAVTHDTSFVDAVADQRLEIGTLPDVPATERADAVNAGRTPRTASDRLPLDAEGRR